MLFLVQNGYGCVAIDRRGHGRSGQPSTGNNMDGYADDLAAVIEALDLRNATLIGHSRGGGEVARYVARHSGSRVAAESVYHLRHGDHIPGHRPVGHKTGLSRYYEMLVAIRCSVARLKKEGNSLEETLAAKPTGLTTPSGVL